MLSQGRFPIIYADPPWKYGDTIGNGKRGAEHKYGVMSLRDMLLLPVKKLASKDAVCLMWVTFPMLHEGIALMSGWGFEYKTVAFNWVKLNSKPLDKRGLLRAQKNGQAVHECDGEFYTSFMGMGRHTRGNGEIVLLGIKGKGVERKNNGVRQEIIAPRREHSRKPAEARDRIVQLYGDRKRIELFARERVDGWHSWGDQL